MITTVIGRDRTTLHGPSSISAVPSLSALLAQPHTGDQNMCGAGVLRWCAALACGEGVRLRAFARAETTAGNDGGSCTHFYGMFA